MSMSNDEIREFVDEKLLEESVEFFCVKENQSKQKILIFQRLTQLIIVSIEEDKIRLVFWEELLETRATIDLNS